MNTLNNSKYIILENSHSMIKVSKKPTPPIRCGVCRKKITMTYIQCKCNGYYCGNHRYANDHDCQYDYKKQYKIYIKKNNPVIKKEKVVKI